MTEKDHIKYDSAMASLVAKEKKLKGVGELVDYINGLQNRIADLEKFDISEPIEDREGEGKFLENVIADVPVKTHLVGHAGDLRGDARSHRAGVPRDGRGVAPGRSRQARDGELHQSHHRRESEDLRRCAARPARGRW